MKLELPDILATERTPLVETLLALLRLQQDRIQQLEATVQELRDEIALLKKQKPRPDIKPSVLEAGPPKTQGMEGSKRPGSAKRPKTAELHIHQEVPLHPEDLPVGATFRGYEAYVVQELLIENDNTRYLRARYDLPGGGSVLAPFPLGVLPVEGGHFGANLIAYILDQYHQAQVTEPLLLAQLWEYGIDISAGQLHRILTENKEPFHQEKAEVLAGRLGGVVVPRYRRHRGTSSRQERLLHRAGQRPVRLLREYRHQEPAELLTGPARQPTRLRNQRDHPGLLGTAETGDGLGGPTDARPPGVRRGARVASPPPGVGHHGRAARPDRHGGGVVGWPGRPGRRGGLGRAQRWRSAVRRVRPCELLDSRRATAGQTGAAQRPAPRRHREHPEPNLGTLPRPESLSGTAR